MLASVNALRLCTLYVIILSIPLLGNKLEYIKKYTYFTCSGAYWQEYLLRYVKTSFRSRFVKNIFNLASHNLGMQNWHYAISGDVKSALPIIRIFFNHVLAENFDALFYVLRLLLYFVVMNKFLAQYSTCFKTWSWTTYWFSKSRHRRALMRKSVNATLSLIAGCCVEK